jgi:hypothetical protein
MPFLVGPIGFTGTLDNISAFPMRGVKGIVVRRKGGPSREKVLESPGFENTRRTMSEFGGCSRTGSYVRKAMHQLCQLSDYNFGSDINSIEFGAWGRRKIILSEHTRILEGFQTTEKAPSFNSIIRTPVYYSLDRANRSARVEIPELLRDINYFPQNNHAMFRLTITLGIIPDVRFNETAKEYLPPTWYNQACYAKAVSTDWSPSLEGMSSTTLNIATDMLPPEDGWTLMLAIGIQYGAFRGNGEIVEVERFGAAKILALRGKDSVSGGNVGGEGDGEREGGFEDEVVKDDVVVAKNEKASEVYREPQVRYVYTTKAVETPKTVIAVYSYTISVPVEGSSSSTNTKPKASVSKQVPRRKQVELDGRQSLLPMVMTFTGGFGSLKTPIGPGTSLRPETGLRLAPEAFFHHFVT